MNFTEQQLKAISSQTAKTLVSAAAGSGKTRVLTQRIEALVRGADLDTFAEDDGTQVNLDRMEDISSMLVMTFTRAAASEMRGRIVEALTNAASAQAEQHNEEAASALRRQAEKAAGADISTVHSFCSRVIGENYELADVCAGFGILSEEQAKQLKNQAAREIFDERYEADDMEIVQLLRRFTNDGRDARIMEVVLRIYDQMMGTDDWEAWLDLPFDPDRPREMVMAWEEIQKSELGHAIDALDRARVLTEQGAKETGDKKIATKAGTDGKLLARFEEALDVAEHKGIEAGVEKLGKFKFASTKGMPGILGTAQGMREEARKAVKLFQSTEYTAGDTSEMLAEAHEDLRILIQLVRDFTARYAEKKRALNKVDYADLEHKALQVLRILKEQGNGYDKRYRHVFVDEYQDTNQVQESILRELTGEDNHVFMVGDLKQSIYGFRFADPRIFRSKDVAFAKGGDDSQVCIHMNDNFRSSGPVIDAVNAIMSCLMKESLGGVDYDEKQKLILGREDADAGHAQILIADAGAGPITEDGRAKDEMEAEMIASRIAELADEGRNFSDIAILLRSRSERVGALESALEARGIPYAADLDSSRTFTELDIFLNLLELIVNERRDVPLLSVMRSYMFGFTEADFARIVNWTDAQQRPYKGEEHVRQAFFGRLSQYRQAGQRGLLTETEDKELAERVEKFFTELDKLRVMGTDMALGRFAEEVGARYEFGSYLLTRPAGPNRKKAYDALLAAIADQQEIHGNSLYRVLEAVRKIRKTGKLEAQTGAAETDAVRIMTVHGSKGLEFPIVFLAATDRAFNTRSTGGDFLLSDKYGVTTKYVNEATHMKHDTVETAVVKRYIEETQKSEELRMLYVAMTRAREHLYVCGAAQDEESSENRWRALAGRYESAGSMLDWVMGAYYEMEDKGIAPENMYAGSFWQHGRNVGTVAAAKPEEPPEDIVALIDEAREEGRTDFFGLEERPRVAAVQGVSKRVAAERRAKDAAEGKETVLRGLRPVLNESSDGTLSGAERGTLLHKVLRYMVRTRTKPEEAIGQMLSKKLVTRSEAEQLTKDTGALQAFVNGALYERVLRSPKVLTEQAFELLMPAPEGGDYSGGRMRLQGMVDLAFLEDGAWVLVDYKSDRGTGPDALVKRYSPQIGYYRQALERLTGREVRESYLYSLERREAIPVPAPQAAVN